MNGFGHVWAAAEIFRRTHLTGEEDRLPVDVFTVVELKLRLDVIPFDDLAAKYGIEAALQPDFAGIYVDAESYVLWECGPIWKQNRLRFSVAHELGHYVLHREIAAKMKFKCFEDFARHFNANNGPKYLLEQEANEFGGRLLVPVERLQAFYDVFARRFERSYRGGEIRTKCGRNLPNLSRPSSAYIRMPYLHASTVKGFGPVRSDSNLERQCQCRGN
ncbi:MAG: ImmA/IrrE family metallo-endopeptidase [Opitutaceae bacterium]|nr:ImmA/IrrE family metallo-endopeptidase [Opitutaceae bacterium]